MTIKKVELHKKKKKDKKSFIKASNELEIMIKSIKINNPGLPIEIELAFRITDRKFFIKKNPYEDNAQYIALGQTISQPTTIARMLRKLQLHSGLDVLEIGTNTGYHACLTSYLVYPGTVTSCEIFPELAERAKKNINNLIKHLKNKKLKKSLEINIFTGDALNQHNSIWFRKYDRIYFTAGISKEQVNEVKNMAQKLLKDQGLLLFPSRNFFDFGGLELWKKEKNKIVLVSKEQGYSFVPIIRQKDLNNFYKVIRK